jgi:hypothetical protein
MTGQNMRTENDLQRAVAKVLDASGLVWQHTPNGGNRSARTGALMKAMGAKPGVPDVLIYQPYTVIQEVHMTKARAFTLQDMMAGKTTVKESRIVCGLAIELKVGKNKPSASQEEWAGKLRGCGWRVETLRSVDEVLTVLRECYTERFPI